MATAGDRTTNVVWKNSTDPQLLYGTVSIIHGDTFKIIYGKGARFIPTAVDDDDVIVSGVITNGCTITIGAIGAGGSPVTGTRFNIHFIVVLDSQ